MIENIEVKDFEVVKPIRENRYCVTYWKIINDEKDWREEVVEARTLEQALEKFRENNPLVKIQSIEEVWK